MKINDWKKNQNIEVIFLEYFTLFSWFWSLIFKHNLDIIKKKLLYEIQVVFKNKKFQIIFQDFNFFIHKNWIKINYYWYNSI